MWIIELYDEYKRKAAIALYPDGLFPPGMGTNSSLQALGMVEDRPEIKGTTKVSLETSQKEKAQNSSQFSVALTTTHKCPRRCPITHLEKSWDPSCESKALQHAFLLCQPHFRAPCHTSKEAWALNVVNNPWLDLQSAQASHDLNRHAGFCLLLNHGSAINGKSNQRQLIGKLTIKTYIP